MIDSIEALENKLAEAFIEEVEVLIIIELTNISRGVEGAENNDNSKS